MHFSRCDSQDTNRYTRIKSGDGNRTRASALPRQCSTFELRQNKSGCGSARRSRPTQSSQAHAAKREVQACVVGFSGALMEPRRARCAHETRRKRSTRAGITQKADFDGPKWHRALLFAGAQPLGRSHIGTRGGMCRGAFHDVDQGLKVREVPRQLDRPVKGHPDQSVGEAKTTGKAHLGQGENRSFLATLRAPRSLAPSRVCGHLAHMGANHAVR